MIRQIVLDTETTGLRVDDGHRVIEIGCLELINRKLTGAAFHEYLDPEREVEEGASAIHGITNAFLAGKPLFNQIAAAFVDFISGAELIIHNAPFDISFLDQELSLANQGFEKMTKYCKVVDTLPLARQLHPGQRNTLDALCKRYAVDLSRRDLHGALVDANLLAQVYLSMTGGQGSFFDGFQETQAGPVFSHKNLSSAESSVASHEGLIVQKASAMEEADHEAYLALLKKQGKCLWE